MTHVPVPLVIVTVWSEPLYVQGPVTPIATGSPELAVGLTAKPEL